MSGRSYPVEIRYRPVVDPDDPDADPDRDEIEAIGDADRRAAARGPRRRPRVPARRAARSATPRTRWRSATSASTEILPLYARLSTRRAAPRLRAPSRRRVVLATNVAETSLTVPGIRYVVDTGLARVSRYSRRLKVQRLPIEKVSQASANQRAGRCGRVADGICIRLYAEDDFDARPQFTDPEILRTNLASVILQMIALDLGDLAAFPFVDKPDTARRRRRPRAAQRARRAGARPDPHRRRPRARRRCPSTPGWAACSSRRTGPAACARCWSSPRRCRCRTRASGRPSSARPPTHSTRGSPRRERRQRVRRRRIGLPRLPQALGVRPGAARRAHRQPVPQAAARGVPALPAHPRVAGPARPAAQRRPQRGA